jgi:sulfonate transport system substrate-binding protein
MSDKKIRIGGVPEHFNLPIRLAIEEGRFQKKNIEAVWKDYPGGTGEMAKALKDDESDICIALTEGVISAIINGNPSKIISGYIKTPLIWGVHTGANSKTTYNKAFNERIAISRLGSGSHLMPTVDARIKGKKIDADQFVVVKNIDGALESLNNGESDIFYWEKYTTKPYVQKKLLKRIGEFISPWPCFIMAATEKIIIESPELLNNVLHIIHSACDDFMKDPNAIHLVSQRYGINETDASYWFNATEWATDSWVSDKMLESVLFTLKNAGLLPQGAQKKELIWKRD